MQRIFRSLSAIFLALVLTLTAQSMALARGMSGPGGEIILCTGNGPVMVQVDSDGNPTGSPHVCPDFTLSLFVATEPPEAEDFVPIWLPLQSATGMFAAPQGRDAPPPSARGPPAQV